MKKRSLLVLVLSVAMVLCTAFALSACLFDLPEYTVTFSLGVYEGEGEAPEAITAEEFSEIFLPEAGVTWEGHDFLYWQDESGKTYEANTAYTVTANVTLTAQWDGVVEPGTDPEPVPQYTVTFLANGETFATKTVNEGETVSAPDPAPTHDTKTFHHWSTEDSEVYNFDTPVTDNLTLDASFYVYVDFDINGAEGTAPEGIWGNSMWITYLELPDDTGFWKDGFRFDGWQDTDGKIYAAGYSFSRLTESKTFTAVWSDASQEQTYTVSYALASSSAREPGVVGTLPESFEAKEGDIITIPEVDWTLDGYHIDYWIVQYQDEYGWTKDNAIGNLQSGETFTMPARDVRIAPVWLTPGPVVAKEYSVSYALASRDDFVANVTGTLPASFTAKEGDTITVPTVDWTMDGYYIQRWIVQYDDNDFWATDSSIGNLQSGETFLMPAYDIRIAPVWVKGTPAPATVTVIYDANGGSGTQAGGTVESGKSILVPLESELTFIAPAGQTFVGWSLTKDASSGILSGGIPASTWSAYVQNDTLTIYAIWSGESDPDEVTFADIVGVWTNGTDKLVITAEGAKDGGVGILIYDNDYMSILDYGYGVFVAYASDYTKDYTLVLEDGVLTVYVYDYGTENEDDVTFETKNDFNNAPASDFAGRWLGYNNVKWLISEDGNATYASNTTGAVSQSTLTIIDSYAVLSLPYLSTTYYFLLEKGEGSLTGYYIREELAPLAVTFTKGDWFILTVDGDTQYYVNSGAAITLTDPDAKDGKNFDHWAYADTNETFDPANGITEDTSIIAVYESATVEPAPAEGEYTGDSFSIKTGFATNATVTSLSFNDDFTAVTLFFEDGHTEECTIEDVTNIAWLPEWNPEAAKGDTVYWLKYTSNQFEYFFSFDSSKSTVKVYNEDDDLLGTFTKAGGNEGGSEETVGDVYVGDATYVKSGFLGSTTYVFTKFVFNYETNEVTYTVSINGEETTETVSWTDNSSYNWKPNDGDYYTFYVDGVDFYLAFNADKSELQVCDSDDEPIVGTFYKA